MIAPLTVVVQLLPAHSESALDQLFTLFEPSGCGWVTSEYLGCALAGARHHIGIERHMHERHIHERHIQECESERAVTPYILD